MTNDKLIKCPKCGATYHPAEIYYPNSFFGHPEHIVKDEQGHVEFWSGDGMDLSEEYTCDTCGCAFEVTASIDFKTKINKEHDFSEDYTSTIYANRLNLEEPSAPVEG